MQKIKTGFNIAASYAIVAFATLLASCQSNKVNISGQFIGGKDDMVYLEEITANESRIIDSVKLNKDGEFKFSLKGESDEAKLYNVLFDWSRIPLFAANGESIKINSVGNIAKNYTIEGSNESSLVREFYLSYSQGMLNLDKIAEKYSAEKSTEEERKELAREYQDEHNRIKREQLAFIIKNKSNLAAVYALYQRLPNDSYLFNGLSDVIYYRTVADALSESYPTSPYLKSINSEINRYEALQTITSNIKETGYPDLELPDIYGKKQKLSSLEGNVILLDFWSAQIGSSNQYNAELKEIYEKYHDKGFEVYQVGIDNSKSLWIHTIQEQKLPWVSVSDLKGNRSTSLSLYNVTRLPSNVLISKSGDLVVRDIYGDSLLDHIKAELAK